MRKSLIIFMTFLLGINVSYTQEIDSLFDRLLAIDNYGTQYYSVDGIEISTQTKHAAFKPKSLKKNFYELKIKDHHLTMSNNKLEMENYHWSITNNKKNLMNHSSYYLVKQKDDLVTGVIFNYPQKILPNNDFEIYFIDKFIKDQIPDSIYHTFKMDSIRFVNRYLKLPNECRWMGVNNIQFSYNGQMNWSIHHSLESAQNSIESQFLYSSSLNQIKIHTDEYIPVVFENVRMRARKVVFKTKGLTKFLMLGSGSADLIVYYVATKVGGRYVSCILSHWSNDKIGKNGLPYLLSQVMKLE